MRIANQLPALIKPMVPAQSGPSGPVPLSYSFTWTKYQPKIIDEMNRVFISTSTLYCALELDIRLEPIVEPEVVLLLTGEQIKNLTKKLTGKNNQKISTLSSFGACLRQLGRPVTCIFLTGAKLRTSKKNRPSGVCEADRISINQLCAQLQIEWGVRATRVCSDVNEVALILASYTRSIGERPFKEGRLLRDEGLTFLPDAVRMGLSGCASRGRGPGQAPTVSDPTELTVNPLAVHAWANRVWLAQLGQWRGVTGEIAHAVSTVYPTALAFYRACQRYSTGMGDNEGQNVNGKRTHPMETSLAELEVRRGAGVLTSRRRLGPEFARRLVTHFTHNNPNHVID
ncbi:crossover junction endonuclease EME1 [Paragonimus westermani]|uniref:Crossover junction endonuclease EME1 n=1 Tax=Paragonimus westermani TaxID=34504 RepID=A0A5J4NJA8_9TREM|nr:crossover junction endonuclease EME1 [Paragonimus westermani]